MTTMAVLEHLIRDEEGQDLVEYALLLTLISTLAILAVTNLGTKISSYFTNAGSKLPAS